MPASRDPAGTRAFASGCTALTGVEAISNGVPAFKKPKAKNAADTLAIMGFFSITMFVGITALALTFHVHIAESPTDLGLAPDTPTQTVLAQVAEPSSGAGRSSTTCRQRRPPS